MRCIHTNCVTSRNLTSNGLVRRFHLVPLLGSTVKSVSRKEPPVDRMNTLTKPPDVTLSFLKINLAAIEKKPGPAEAVRDALGYQRDTLLATIALISEEWQKERA